MAKKSKLTRKDTNDYQGIYNDFQTFGENFKGKRYQEIEVKVYSEYQNFLYKRALFGLKMYTQEEIKAMHWQKRKRIIKVHKRTQKEINLLKQSKLIEFTNKIFGLFEKGLFFKEAVEIQQSDFEKYTDPDFICGLSFKDLGLEKSDIVNFMIQKGILPTNFYTCSEN